MAYTVVGSPSAVGGMGAILSAGGVVSFRVWTPDASAVGVLLRADSGDPYQKLALAADDASRTYWSADVSGLAPGHEYRFVITNDPGRGPFNPGGDFEHVDPRARRVRSSNVISPGYIVDQAFAFAAFTPPPPQDFLIYQMQIGSFRGKNDSIAPPHNAANFKDIIAKLPYIVAMGFNAVQFLPTGAFPGDTGEGYAPTNFFAPEPSQGLPDDLRQLVDACHRAGLAVLFDVIYNHVPDSDDNLWQLDGNYANRGGGIYFADADRSPWGWRLAADRQPVHDFFLDNARMWLRELDADGLRFDSLHNVFPEGGAWWLVTDLAQELGGKMLIAEHDNPVWAMSRYPLEACWDMGSADRFRDQVLGQCSLGALQDLLGWDGMPHAASYIRYLLGSHDQIYNACDGGSWQCGDSRYFVERVGEIMTGRSDWTALAKARLGWALNVTMPGTPMLFMGSEVSHYGYWSPDTDQYGDHRFDWSLTADAVGRQMISLVTDANAVRRAHPALRTDTLKVTHYDETNGVLAFQRWNDEGDVILTVVNIGQRQFGDAVYGVNLAGDTGRWEEILNSQSPQYGGWADSGNYLAFPTVQLDGNLYIRLPKLAVLVFRKT